MPKATQAKRYLRIESNLGPDALILTRAAGRERLGSPFDISLEFTAESGDVDLDALAALDAAPADPALRSVPDHPGNGESIGRG